MARLIGYMANRTDRLADVLTEEQIAVGPASDAGADAWGIGFYQAGEVLHKKRPRHEIGGDLAWRDVAGDVRSDCAVIHFRHATVGDFRSENTHPFRMRQWIFAHNGTVEGFDAIRERLTEGMPDFLQRNIRGTTDSEHIFHAFLSFLHDAGQLDSREPDEKVVVAAMRGAVSQIDRLVAEIDAPAATLDFVATDGRTMYALHRGHAMHFVARSIDEGQRNATPLRYVMLVSNGRQEPTPDWVPVAQSQIVVVRRSLEVVRHA